MDAFQKVVSYSFLTKRTEPTPPNIGPHQLQLFKLDAAQRSSEGVFPTTFFSVRVGLFHVSFCDRLLRRASRRRGLRLLCGRLAFARCFVGAVSCAGGFEKTIERLNENVGRSALLAYLQLGRGRCSLPDHLPARHDCGVQVIGSKRLGGIAFHHHLHKSPWSPDCAGRFGCCSGSFGRTPIGIRQV